jgi:hypothetical protein
MKNESRFSTTKCTSFYSDFNVDSEYVILFLKIFWKKMALPPLVLFLRFHIALGVTYRQNFIEIGDIN